jgi:hypothetical protein
MREAGAVLGFFLLAGCTESAPRSSASSGEAPGGSRDASWVTVTTVPDAPATGDPSADAALGDATLGPAQPVIPCDADGAPTESPVCTTPPPACVNSQIAVNYSGGQCVSGFCVWNQFNVDCSQVDASCAGALGIDGGLGDAGSDASVWKNVEGCLLIAPAAPDPPPLACNADAPSDSGVCPLPASTCADSEWLVYYDDGQCTSGLCTWQKKELFCTYRCFQGACGSRPTAPLSPTAQ